MYSNRKKTKWEDNKTKFFLSFLFFLLLHKRVKFKLSLGGYGWGLKFLSSGGREGMVEGENSFGSQLSLESFLWNTQCARCWGFIMLRHSASRHLLCTYHHIFPLNLRPGLRVFQTGLQLLGFGDLPSVASRVARTIGIYCHCTLGQPSF